MLETREQQYAHDRNIEQFLLDTVQMKPDGSRAYLVYNSLFGKELLARKVGRQTSMRIPNSDKHRAAPHKDKQKKITVCKK